MDGYHLTPTQGGWALKKAGTRDVLMQEAVKAVLVRRLAAYFKERGLAASVRIHKRNGRIQEERTYPRSADPRRSKG